MGHPLVCPALFKWWNVSFRWCKEFTVECDVILSLLKTHFHLVTLPWEKLRFLSWKHFNLRQTDPGKRNEEIKPSNHKPMGRAMEHWHNLLHYQGWGMNGFLP